jgi:hypothetical protein
MIGIGIPISQSNMPLPMGVLPFSNWSPRATFTFLNNGSASGRSAFSAFFYGAHSAFSLGANAEPGRPDHDTDAWRRRSFLNNPASLRGRLLNDVIVRKAGRNNKRRQSGTGQNSSHGSLPSLEMTLFNSPEAVRFQPARANDRLCALPAK